MKKEYNLHMGRSLGCHNNFGFLGGITFNIAAGSSLRVRIHGCTLQLGSVIHFWW